MILISPCSTWIHVRPIIITHYISYTHDFLEFINSDVLKVSGTIPTGGPTITISLPVTDYVPEANEAPFPAAYHCAKKALKSILHAEVEMYSSIGDGASIFLLIQQAGGSIQTVVQKFLPQLLVYSCKEYPFGNLMGSKSMLDGGVSCYHI